MDHQTKEDTGQSKMDTTERLWTPWRMRYVGGETRESGCIFCTRLAGSDDVASLIVHREADVFVIMNLYPYNTAHLMLVPTSHVDSPESASEEALARLGTLLQPTLRALRRVLGCHGFNIGFNVGDVAGAGVAAHLHQHVVPRWTGDANFMPILAGTTVMPEVLTTTYGKVRAELQRELLPPEYSGRDEVRIVLRDTASVVVIDEGDGPRLPSAIAAGDEPLWKAALRGIRAFAFDAEISGWAGQEGAGPPQPAILTVRADIRADLLPEGVRIVDAEAAVFVLRDEEEREAMLRALRGDVSIRSDDL